MPTTENKSNDEEELKRLRMQALNAFKRRSTTNSIEINQENDAYESNKSKSWIILLSLLLLLFI